MKKLLSKMVGLILAVISIVTFSVGCVAKKNLNEEVEYTVDFSSVNAATQETITVLIPDNEPERKKMNAWISGFNEKYPNIKVNINTLVIAQYNSTVMKQSQAGELADIVWTNSSNCYYLIANGFALNLNSFIADAKEQDVFDYENDFTNEFKKMSKFGDKVYAVPRSTDTVVTFYNKSILSKAGVDMSLLKNGWTWEDFLAVCHKVRDYYDAQDKTNFYPIDANLGWESVAYAIVKSFGGEVIGKDGKFALTTETASKVHSFIQTLVSKRFIPEKNDSGSNFESGTGAMLFQSAAIDNYQNTAILKDQFDIVSFPLINGESAAIGSGFAGYAITKGAFTAKNQNKMNVIAAFMAYLMSFDGQQKLGGDGGLTLPSIRKDLISNPQANWSSKYGSFNTAAYSFGEQNKIDMNFLSNASPLAASGILSSLSTYVGANCISKKDADAYKIFKAGIEDAIEDAND